MKRFFKVILSILTFFTAITTLILFLIGYVTDYKVTKIIIETVDIENVVSNIDKTSIYNQASEYGINKDKIDEIINSSESKEYYNIIIQDILNKNEYNEASINNLIIKANEKYNLNLSTEQIEKLQSTSNEIVKNQTYKIAHKKEVEQSINFLNVLRSTKIKVLSVIILVIEIIGIIFLSIKEKSYFLTFGIITLALGITTLLGTMIIQVGLAMIKPILINIFKVLLNKCYITSLLMFIVSTIFFISNKKIGE